MGVLEILAMILGLLGIIGSVVPVLPGPPLSWLGVLLLYLDDRCTTSFMLIWLAVTIVVTVLDYLLPGWITRKMGGHKEASRGSLIGLLVGMIIPPIGMLIGSLIGAFVGEYYFAHSEAGPSVKAAMGAFLGFILSTGMKLIVCGVLMFKIVCFSF